MIKLFKLTLALITSILLLFNFDVAVAAPIPTDGDDSPISPLLGGVTFISSALITLLAFLLQRQIPHRNNKENSNSIEDLTGHIKNDQGDITTDWREILLFSRRRLMDENLRLKKSATTSLMIGIFTALLIVFFLFYVIYANRSSFEIPKNWLELVFLYGPNIAYIIVTQFVAVFFLRNFQNIEKEIQRNQREITTIELRLVSGTIAQSGDDKLHFLSDKLAIEERDFIIAKSEKPTQDANAENYKDLLNQITALMKTFKP